MKATHFGECQLCGRQQKLPNGRMSIHGYAVQWSQFVGTCPGSKHLSYERSADLLSPAAVRADERAAFLLEAAAGLDASNSLLVSWRRELPRVSRRDDRKYSNERVELVDDTSKDYPCAVFAFEGKTYNAYAEFGIFGCALSVAKGLRERAARGLRQEAANHREYAAWARARAAAWKLADLQPVPPEAVDQLRMGLEFREGTQGWTLLVPVMVRYGFRGEVRDGWTCRRESDSKVFDLSSMRIRKAIKAAAEVVA
jgi:hypothetical protein